MAQPANKTQWKTGELLEWTTQFFTRAGIDEARLSAELLLAHALGTSRNAYISCGRCEKTRPCGWFWKKFSTTATMRWIFNRTQRRS